MLRRGTYEPDSIVHSAYTTLSPARSARTMANQSVNSALETLDETHTCRITGIHQRL
jgi:hypothetical protein